MNLGIYRSWHAIVAALLVGLLFAWHALAPLPYGSRDDANVLFLLTTGWIAFACYVVLALYGRAAVECEHHVARERDPAGGQQEQHVGVVAAAVGQRGQGVPGEQQADQQGGHDRVPGAVDAEVHRFGAPPRRRAK